MELWKNSLYCHRVADVRTYTLTIALLVALVPFVPAQDAHSSEASVTSNGYIRAENGVFSLSDNILCSYSSASSQSDSYVRQCYTLSHGEWKSAGPPEKATTEPADYLDFAPCDPLNQLNVAVQHSDIAALLPRSAALKQVTETEQSAVAVYSDSPDEKVHYSLRLALLVRRNDHWSRASDVSVGADGNFCGMRIMQNKNSAVALIYIDEVAGSSEYSAIRSFRLSWPR